MLAVGLIVPSSAGSADSCRDQTVRAGIATVRACMTAPSNDGTVTTTGPQDVELNGFVVRLGQGERLSANPATRVVTSHGRDVQLMSRNWPVAGQSYPMGRPQELSFVAPTHGSLALEDVRFATTGSRFADALGGLSFVGSVDSPVALEEDGEGSMDITVALSGYFTLKGKPQTATIKLPTAMGKGTTLDGFELKLKKIDALKLVTIEDFEAEYSASKRVIAGGATAVFPFAGDKGLGVSFRLERGALTELNAKAAGLKIPIFSGGFLTEIGGGFRTSVGACGREASLMASASAEFGSEVPSPFGKIVPLQVDADLAGGAGELPLPKCSAFFRIRGGAKVLNVPVADALLEIYLSGAVNLHAGLGIGVPSFKNAPRDPFYVGARVGGWYADGKFQLTGDGRVRVLGYDVTRGSILVNHRALGACFKLLFVNAGAVYVYRDGRKVRAFIAGCSLDGYREKFPRGASASQVRPRRVRLDGGQIALQATGRGGPPRFTARSSDGRVYRSPARGAGPWSIARDHVFLVNETGTNTTHLFIRKPRGTWTITPQAGSPVITSLKAGRRQPRERVEAEVRGKGAVRDLVWRSRGRRHTRLIFSEMLPGGVEVPILNTDREDGRHVFRTSQGGGYGRRKLRVRVQHGFGVTQDAQVDRYRVNEPRPLQEPARVRARRYGYNVHVTWSPVRGAHGYLVEIDEPGRRNRVGLVRIVSRRARRTIFRETPGGGRLIARVQTLNSDGEPGPAELRYFATGPSADTLREAVRASARSARLRRRFVRAVTQCPELDGHCLVRIDLLSRRGRRIGRVRFQQAPDTFRLVRIRPHSRRVRRMLRRGRNPHIRMRLAIKHAATSDDRGRIRATKLVAR